MGEPFAEVIGDPAASIPYAMLLRHWLTQTDTRGVVHEAAVEADNLTMYLAERHSDPAWRGCIADAPHRKRLFSMVSVHDPRSLEIGDIQCVVPEAGRLMGVNLDLAGIEEALDRVDLEGTQAAIIGTGSTARATIAYLETRALDGIAVLTRSELSANTLVDLAPGTCVEMVAPERASESLAAASLIVNTTPFGLGGTAMLPHGLLEELARCADGKVLFDASSAMADTALLQVGRAHGARTIDGLTMLLGKARLCFELLFEHPAPPANLIVSDMLRRSLSSAP